MVPRILAFSGSPRLSGNSTRLLEQFVNGAAENGVNTEIIHPHQLNLKHCTGCLRCNILKKCSIRDDDWGHLSEKILAADVLVFASPIYFHHLPGPMKTMIDRFRSFMHVQITESGLRHTPWQVWKKEFVLLLSMGSSDDSDSDPLVELFRFMTSILGQENRLHLVKAARLAVANQVTRSSDELHTLYEKLDLPPHLAEQDFVRNNRLLDDCYQLGFRISKK